MTGKNFLNRVAKGKKDIIQILLSILQRTDCAYCVIDGFGVNAYAEPVVSLDLDLVVVADRISDIQAIARAEGMKVEEFEHSVNLSMHGSDLRVQLQKDNRYQDFLPHREQRNVLGYTMSVAGLHDVLRGKVWAYSDETRRKSERQKDLSDIMRLVEAHPELRGRLPSKIASLLE
ncbi:MAG: hypothetical protein HZA50_07820 [Planctomycetes bacterium]|nr:hypothetical protein [Planctomycetota bacterium]